LLLNLRDSNEQCLVILLSDIRIATIRQIAAALDMPAEQFALIWKDLPMDDARIAEHLGVNRQQVSNFRLSARRRLCRRMKALDTNKYDKGSSSDYNRSDSQLSVDLLT
jgi:hypothetical protein